MRKIITGPREVLFQARQRGALLLDSILALAIIGGVIAISALIITQENQRQEDALVASSLRMLTEASQDFVGDRYDTLRAELFDEAEDSGVARLEIPMSELVNQGYLSQAMLDDENQVRNFFEHDFVLLLRGVDVTSTDFPPPAMTFSEIDDSGGPIDGDMEIESILVSHDGQDVPGQRGGPIVARTGLFNAGFMVDENEVRGPLGSFSFEIGDDGDGPYDDFENYPGESRFVSLISLVDIGVLGFSEGDGSDLEDAFRRCADIDQATDPDEYEECVESENLVYSDVIFNFRDDGDTAPAITNIHNIACGDGLDEADREDSFLLVDCSETDFSGDVSVGGDLSVGDFIMSDDTLFLGGDAEGDEVIFEDGDDVVFQGDVLQGGDEFILQDGDETVFGDLYDLVFTTETTDPEETVDVPGQCGDPEIFTNVESVSDKFGRGLSGYRAFAQPDDANDPNEWELGLLGFSTENFCSTTSNTGSGIEIVPINKESGNAEYVRVLIGGQEFGFPVIGDSGGVNSGVDCVEFALEPSPGDPPEIVTISNFDSFDERSYERVYVVDEFGSPIEPTESPPEESYFDAIDDVFADTIDEFVDIYLTPPGYGRINYQIRCGRDE